ncbi:MAG: TIGR03546 family protein [Spirochaetaceae bacterium]|nr:TIGR03546 family protein [Spirochaetaceae bacterium]
MIVKWIVKSIAAINANNRPGEVAAAIAIGITLGLIPAGNIIWVALLIAVFFIKIHFGMVLVFIAIIKPIAHFADPLFDFVGYQILTAISFEGIFTKWYNTPIVPYTAFNNTAVMGSLIVMFLLFIPLWFATSKLVKVYREKVRDKFLSSTVVKKFKSLPIISQIVNLAAKANELKNF